MNLIFLIIEFLDELVYGVSEAAWPLIRTDLRLDYVQIGLLLSVPGIISGVIGPFLGILGDVWKRRVLILGGGIGFALACLLTGLSPAFAILLFALCLFYPSSGAFVSLSQATLMDSDPGRHEQNMARWTFAGSLGVVAGPLLLSGMAFLGFGWRGVFIALAAVTVPILAFAWSRVPESGSDRAPLPHFSDVWTGIRKALSALRRGEVLRWLVLLEFSDLMLDVLLGFLALYFVDVSGLTAGQAALGVAVWSGVGLLGDFLLIPLLKKSPRSELSAPQRPAGTYPFSCLPACPQSNAQVRPAWSAWPVQFRLVCHLAGQPLYLHAGAIRHRNDSPERGWIVWQTPAIRHRAGGAGLWPRLCHVAAACGPHCPPGWLAAQEFKLVSSSHSLIA